MLRHSLSSELCSPRSSNFYTSCLIRVAANDAGSVCSYSNQCIASARNIQRADVVYSPSLLHSVLSTALDSLFGCIGGAILFEVANCDAKSGKAIVILDAR